MVERLLRLRSPSFPELCFFLNFCINLFLFSRLFSFILFSLLWQNIVFTLIFNLNLTLFCLTEMSAIFSALISQSTRFAIGDLSNANCGKELDERLKMIPSTCPSDSCTVAEQQQRVTDKNSCDTTNNDEDVVGVLTWYPAAEFLELERHKTYSFTFPAVCVDAVTTDGPKFTQILDTLTDQLQQHVAKACQLISINEKIPQFDDKVEELMRLAIGRTQLLLGKRMKQFREQLNRHLNPIPGQKITKLNDLHGLWALIDMQLDDLRSIFNTIEQYRLRDWSVAAPAPDN